MHLVNQSKRLVLSSIFLFCLTQFVSCQIWTLPLGSYTIEYFEQIAQIPLTEGEISNGPIIIEREGLDRNGNRFYEQNFQYKNQKHIPDNLESVDLDYFEAPKLQKSKRRFNTEDRTIQDNDDALNQINFIEGLLESISNPTFNQKNVYDEKFFQNFFESSEKTEQMPIKVKNEINDEIQSDLLSKLIKDNLEKENNLLKPNQNQQKLENLFDKINEKETVTEKPENKEALNKLKERLEANENRIAENLHSINSRNSIEKRPFSAFTDLDSMTNEELVDDSYIYIELDKKITEEEAKDLVGYIAQFTFIPLEWFKDISINENLVLFKIDNQDVNLNHVVNEIIKNKENILQDKRLKIISSNRGNVILNDLYKNSDESKYFLIVTIVICGSVIALLVSLIAVFVVKRRTHLRNKLIDDVSSMKKKKQEDEESLVESEKKSKIERIKSAWPFSKLTFKKENVQENLSTDDYEKLCRQEMQTKKNQSIVSPLNSTRCTDINTPNLFSPVPLNSAGNVISTPLTATCEDRNVVSTRSSTSS